MSPEAEEPVDPADELMFLCLGGGNEVGRSCHIIQYKGKTVMVRRYACSPRLSLADICVFSSLMLGCILLTKDLPHSLSTMNLISALWTSSS